MSSVVNTLELQSNTVQNEDVSTLTNRSLEAPKATGVPADRATEAEREALRRWTFPRRIPASLPPQAVDVAAPAEQVTSPPAYVAASDLSHMEAILGFQVEPSHAMWYSSSESSQGASPVAMQAVLSNDESVVGGDLFEEVDLTADDVTDNLDLRNFDDSESDSGESSYEGDDELDDDDL